MAIDSPGDPDPVFIPPGSGRALDFLSVTHKLTSTQTGGAYCLFESLFEGGAGNRLHTHDREEEVGYVLEGALEVRLRDGTHVLEAGGLARLPKHLPHALRNPLTTPSRYLFLAVPGGLDLWFDALANARDDGLLDEELFTKLSDDYGIAWPE